MSAKRTSGAFMTSLVLHVIIAAIAGIYLVTQTEQFQRSRWCRSAPTERTTEA